MSWQHLNQPQGWIGVISLSLYAGLAMCACLAVSVFPGRLIHLPRLASRVTMAVRAGARDVIYLSIYLSHMREPSSSQPGWLEQV